VIRTLPERVSVVSVVPALFFASIDMGNSLGGELVLWSQRSRSILGKEVLVMYIGGGAVALIVVVLILFLVFR
jgi:hypothetical protein